MKNREDQLNELISYYKSIWDNSQETLVNCLKEVQAIYGCVPSRVQEQICEAFDVKATLLSAIIKRFPSLKEESVQHEIVICMGTNCMKKGSQQLLRLAERLLHTKANGNPVHGIQLRTSQCLRQCKTSPNAMVDGKLISSMDEEVLRKLISDLKK